MGLGGSKLTLEEQMRANKRMVNRSIRELDRERSTLQQNEAKIVSEIKLAAKKNQVASVKIMAKDLVRTRRHISKFYEMKSHLQGVQLRMQTMKSTDAMARSMASATKAMTALNKQLNIPQLTNILQQFQSETEKLGLTQEVMGDTIDDVMEEAGDAENEEIVVNQVLDEIGIDVNALLAQAPKSKMASQSGQQATAKEALAEGGSNAASDKRNSSHPGGPPPPSAPPSGGDAFSSLEARLNALKK